MITIAIALLMAATFTPITADHALATQAPQNETAENQITDDNRSFLAPFPDFDSRADPGDPVRASHINDLQDRKSAPAVQGCCKGTPHREPVRTRSQSTR